MIKLFQFMGQIIMYGLFALVVGYLATRPAYTHLAPDKAMIKLSFSHAAQRKVECRRRTQEELEALAPNMRRPLDCPRERLPVYIELMVDDEMLFQAELPPTGLARDGSSTLYKKFPVTPGQHHIQVRMRDSARTTGFDYEGNTDITLAPQQNFVIDFRPTEGGFIFI